MRNLHALNNLFAAVMFAMLLAAATQAEAMILKIDSIEAPLNGEVDIPIIAEEPQQLGPIQFRLLYDPKIIEILEVEVGSSYDGSVTHKNETPGELDIFMTSNAEDGLNEDGPIAVVKAKVTGNKDEKSPLALQYVEAFERDTTAPIYIDVVTSDGELTVVAAPLPWKLIAAIAGGLVLLLLVVAARRGRGGSRTSAPRSTMASKAACPKCGHANEPSVKFCGECGSPMQT